jgi:hypothetical protein
VESNDPDSLLVAVFTLPLSFTLPLFFIPPLLLQLLLAKAFTLLLLFILPISVPFIPLGLRDEIIEELR